MEPSIQLANIDEELVRLWDKELGEKKIHSSLFTCILYIQKEGAEDKSDFYQTVIKSVVAKFPCRVIVIVNDLTPDANYLRTSVSSETLGTADQQIFCEIIQVEVAGKLIERVPFIVLPYLQPDLPVYLVWTQDPATESKILPHLERFADRVIFDAESLHDVQSYSKTVLSLIQRFHCTIGDLHWSALSGWRTIFTQVFETRESFRALAQSTVIRIHYNSAQTAFQKHTEIESAYLQAWLSARLEWKFQSIETQEGNIRLRYNRPLGEVIILLIPGQMEGSIPGSILAVEIESAKDGAHVQFKKDPQTRQVVIEYSEKEFCQLPYTLFLEGASPGEEIIDEIFYPTGGAHYKEMLTCLAQIPWSHS